MWTEKVNCDNAEQPASGRKPIVERDGSERGAALLVAIMFIAILLGLSVAAASLRTTSSDDARRHAQIAEDQWNARAVAETTEASVRTDIPTAYQLEMALAKTVPGTASLTAFDSSNVTNSLPIYDPNSWVVSYTTTNNLTVSGTKLVTSGAGRTSLLGNLGTWLARHKTLPVTYATRQGYQASQTNVAVLEEMFRMAQTGGGTEPAYVLRFAVDSRAGQGRHRQQGQIVLGPANLTNACVGINVSATANPATVSSGSSSTLSITFQSANRIVVTNPAGTTIANQAVTEQSTAQTISVSTGPITAQSTFQISASNSAGCNAQTSVTVNLSSCPTIGITFTASPTQIQQGESSILRWNVTNSSRVTMTGPGVNGTVPATSNSFAVSPNSTATYTLTAVNSQAGCPGATASVTITVGAVCQPPFVNTFTASPDTIQSGQSATIYWEAPGATSVTISPGIGTVASSGSRTVRPRATTTYTLTATNACGSASASTTVTVASAPPPPPPPPPDGGGGGGCTGAPPVINSFAGVPNSIRSGQSATLSWNVASGTTISIDQGVGAVAATGSRSVSPTTTTTYTLTATNACGTVSQSVTIQVTSGPENTGAFDCNFGDGASFGPGVNQEDIIFVNAAGSFHEDGFGNASGTLSGSASATRGTTDLIVEWEIRDSLGRLLTSGQATVFGFPQASVSWERPFSVSPLSPAPPNGRVTILLTVGGNNSYVNGSFSVRSNIGTGSCPR